MKSPFGARCFLTVTEMETNRLFKVEVLMHLMALGAF